MKLAFKSQLNGLFIKRYYNVAGHWHRLEYTENTKKHFYMTKSYSSEISIKRMNHTFKKKLDYGKNVMVKLLFQ